MILSLVRSIVFLFSHCWDSTKTLFDSTKMCLNVIERRIVFWFCNIFVFSAYVIIQQRKIIVNCKHAFLMQEIQLHRKELNIKAFRADRERKRNLFYI